MEFLRRTEPLRLIAARLQVPDLPTISRQAGVNETIRVSVHYQDERSPASIATLIRGLGVSCQLTAAYDQYDLAGKPFEYQLAIPLERYQKLLLSLRQNRFDSMDDAPDLPLDVDLWWIERGSGSFYHDIVLSPNAATGNHREVVLAIQAHLSEAIRELSV